METLAMTDVAAQQQQLVHLSEMSEEMQEEIVSIPKEVILISLVSQEQSLYNPNHENYRNTSRKDTKWREIAESVGWSETQCKAKWKAMRDQYCRELKRSKFNTKANVKWKYFKELDFLRPYALFRNYRPRNKSLNCSSNNNNATTTLLTNTFNSNNNNNSSGGSNNNSLIATDNNNKFPNIKIEAGPYEFSTTAAAAITATQIKNEATTARLLTSLTEEQLSNVIHQQQQEGNWNYLTTTTTPTLAVATTTATISSSATNNNNSNNLLQQQQQTTTAADDALYNAFVDCMQEQQLSTQQHQPSPQQQQQTQQHTLHQQLQHTEEEDDDHDDPIHTFLNIESYFEKELIAMIQQEDILYNSYHPNYRNVKLKMEVWDEISRKLKKTVKQCRLKWKALRDQYIREHKRLKHRENADSLPRWKHYDVLSFLQKFIKHKSNEFDAKNILQIPKTEIDAEMDEHIISSDSPLRSPMDAVVAELQQQHQQQLQQQQLQQLQQQQQQQQHTLPSLTGPHAAAQQQLQQALQHQKQQQQQQQQQLQQHATHDENICVYDEMDIDTYITGDASDDVDVDEEEDHKSQQNFPEYTPSSNNNMSNDNNNASEDDEEDIKSNTTLDDSTAISLPLSQQQQQQQQLQQALAMSVDVVDAAATLTAADESLQHNDFNVETQIHAQPTTTTLLNGVVNNNNNNSNNHIATVATTPTETLANIINIANSATVAPVAAAPAVNHVAATTSVAEDDEVGAFFKAIAMKIRNAKMSPVAFTDLQIDILRVINGTLRNH